MILERDFESKKNRYSANSYLALLEELVILNYIDDLIFIQDNTRFQLELSKHLDDHATNALKDWIAPAGSIRKSCKSTATVRT